ncbi:MAG: hypothetical protein SOR92_10075 [Christensenella hongkongensis]|uniref:hypothetical protein n=1 Tax=Christensenella hongkongensis TaxID=270498 RepID=UPI002A74C45E|nr:hypothetical protein [Christensenella hongkongensis]MDY3004803.1 hypothetical protein [Christensenella hongkongensis]
MNRHKHLKKWFCIVLCVAFGLTVAGGVAFAQETAEPVQNVCNEGCVLETGHRGDCVAGAEEDVGTEGKTPEPTAQASTGLVTEPLPSQSQQPAGASQQPAVESAATQEATAFGLAEGAQVPVPANENTITTVEDLKAALQAGGEIVLGGDIAIADSTKFTITKDTVLDLNGYTLESAYSGANFSLIDVKDASFTLRDSGENGVLKAGNYGIKLFNNSSLTVASGTLEAVKNAAIDTDSYQKNTDVKLNIEGGTVRSGSSNGAIILRMEDSSAVNMTGGRVESTGGGAGFLLMPSSYSATTFMTFDMTGGEIVSQGNGITGRAYEGTIGGNAKIEAQRQAISGGDSTLKPQGASVKVQDNVKLVGGISMLGDAHLEISGGNITYSGYPAVSLKGNSTALISGGEITCTYNSSGNRGSAVKVDQKANCTVTGGTLTATGASNAVALWVEGTDAAANVSGGTLTGHSRSEAIFAPANANVEVTGGTFSSDVSDYVDESAGGLVPNPDGDGFIVAEYAAEAGGQKYVSVQDAVNAANGGTVILLKNTTESITVPEGTTVTLDLATFTLTNEANQHTITNKGTLTISGSGTVDNVSHARGALVNNGTLIMESGKLTRSKEAGVQGSNGGNSWYVVDNNGGTMTMKGGSVVNTSGYSSLIRNINNATFNMAGGELENTFIALKNDDNGIMNVTGGSVSTTAAGGSAIQNWGDLTVSGGVLNAVDGARAIYASAWDERYQSNTVILDGAQINGGILIKADEDYPASTEQPFVTIQGGNISGDVLVGDKGDLTVENGIFNGTIGTEDTGRIGISAGTFAVKPDDSYISPDAVFVKYMAQGADGVYYVGTEEEVKEKLAGAKAGDVIDILQWDGLALDVPEGVTVINDTDGAITINGQTVEPGKEYVGPAEPGTKKITYTDPATGVTLYAEPGTVPEGAYLGVKPIAETDTAYANAKELLKDKAARFVLYDITLLDADGNAIQPEGTVIIGIPVPEEYDTENLAGHRINDDKTTSEYGVAVQEGMAYLQTEHFSLYALAEKGTTGSGAGAGTTGDTTQSNTTTGGTAPKTGDAADMTPYILLVLAAGITVAVLSVVLYRQKKRYEK